MWSIDMAVKKCFARGLNPLADGVVGWCLRVLQVFILYTGRAGGGWTFFISIYIFIRQEEEKSCC